jgi:trehalose/maltose hydrolase-like predicted phosphorylase
MTASSTTSRSEGHGWARPFDPTWCVDADAVAGEDTERVIESLLCTADGSLGTRGVLEEPGSSGGLPVMVGQVYEPDAAEGERLMCVPGWFALPIHEGLPTGRRILDLRDGLLTRMVARTEGPDVRTERFACAGRPGTAVLRADVAAVALSADLETDAAPATTTHAAVGGGGVAKATVTTSTSDDQRDARLDIERIAAYVASPRHRPDVDRARRALDRAARMGPDGLLAEQRRVWSRRWEGCDVEMVGDPESTLAVRFALFHLLSSAGRQSECAIGARGLTGTAYAGHVFWDTEAFVLPVLAGVDDRAARAALEYRIRRLEPARQRARRSGRRGARFPWESAGSGRDVTPRTGINQHGEQVPIHTGELEEHVTADIAWAAWRLSAWQGDWSFLAGRGRSLVVDTARYWASRIRRDGRGRGHIDSVTGPDEYHENVDDDAFTNLMARWNLGKAVELVGRFPDGDVTTDETAAWQDAAESLVDNHDPATGRYEQFAGYDRLDDLTAGDIGRPPFAADLVLGADRLAHTQIIKQADVLMAHHLIPDGVAPGSLVPNLDRYLPRTSHGSSLSPSVHATLLARAGRPSEALELLRLATSIDLEDLTQTTAGGLHLANLGGIWQTVVHGFAGLSVTGPDDRAFSLDPVLPEEWEELRFRVRWHGRRVRCRLRHDGAEVGCDRPLVVSLHGSETRVDPPGGRVA